MDDTERIELEKQIDELASGHLSTNKPIQSRNGRGFRWNSTTGKYEAL